MAVSLAALLFAFALLLVLSLAGAAPPARRPAAGPSSP